MRTSRYLARLLFAAVATLLLTANPAPAAVSPESVIENFDPRTQSPTSGLVADPAGNFYGEVAGGSGAVFELTPLRDGGWARTIIHRFFGGIFGCSPGGGLVRDADGNLYGVGGCGYANGGGSVFELSPPAGPKASWHENILYRFRSVGSGDPWAPHGRLALDAHGNLYGTSFGGGRYGAGTVFRLTPPAKRGSLWSETTVYSFTGGADGLYLLHGVVIDGSGVLFGTTEYGGVASTFCGSGCGTVFALTPPKHGGTWTETVLHAFTGPDGALPECDLIFDPASNLYGTTEDGQYPAPAGTVFQLTRPAKPGAPWTEHVLSSFSANAPAAGYPLAGVVFGGDGALYGTTSVGGDRQKGTVFRLAPPVKVGQSWTESVLHSFGNSSSDGTYPEAALAIGYDGALYGSTVYGGSGACSVNHTIAGCGTAFRISF